MAVTPRQPGRVGIAHRCLMPIASELAVFNVSSLCSSCVDPIAWARSASETMMLFAGNGGGQCPPYILSEQPGSQVGWASPTAVLCRSPQDLPYSTFHRYVRSGVYPIAWARSVSETDDVVCGEWWWALPTVVLCRSTQDWPYSTFHRYVRSVFTQSLGRGSVSETDDVVCGQWWWAMPTLHSVRAAR